MKKPAKLEMDIAILWLQNNEGDIEEKTACTNVANWLIELLEDRMLKEVAKEKGVSIAQVRRALKRIRNNT